MDRKGFHLRDDPRKKALRDALYSASTPGREDSCSLATAPAEQLS
jgi:hypothetical protein